MKFQHHSSRPTPTKRLLGTCAAYLAAFLLQAYATLPAAHATVTAYANTGYTTYTNPNNGKTAKQSLDGEVVSPYFDVYAGGVHLYTYVAEVRSVNFMTLNSGLTGGRYTVTDTPDNGDNGTFTTNLGTASFVQFQLSGCYNTVNIQFPAGYPTSGMLTASTNSTQVKVIGRNGVTIPATVWGAGQSNPQGSISFNICELVDTNGNDIPQQITVEVLGDWLNSLNVFINPAPNSTNGPPTGSGVFNVPAGTTLSPSYFASGGAGYGYTVYHFPHGIYNVTGPLYFGAGVEFYLDDGAIMKYTGSAVLASGQTGFSPLPRGATGALLTVGGYLGGGTYPAIVRGWGILDGQAAETYSLNATTVQNGTTVLDSQPCTPDQQVSAPMCQVAAGTTPGVCGYGDFVLGFQDTNTTTAKPMIADGILLRNSCAYTFDLHHNLGTASSPVTINNIKILNFSGNNPYEGNSDGIDIVSSQYVNITNSFIRSMDDLVSIKQTDSTDNQNPLPTGCTATEGTYPTAGINFVGNTLWNEYAHAMVVGGELYNACNQNEISNPLAADDITFDSNTIIHDTGKGQLMGILDAYGGKVQNVTFSNSTVLQANGLWSYVMAPQNTSTIPGIVGGTAFCNITAPAQSTQQKIIGYGGSNIEPMVGPVPNITEVIALPITDTYNANPMAIQYPPKFYNVTVAGTTIGTTIDGNGYYYQSSDGSSGAGMPQNEVELTVQIRTNTDPNSIWAYNQSQIAGDMYGPQYFTGTFSCPVSSLYQVPN